MSGSLVIRTPPPPAERFLPLPQLKQPASPMEPRPRWFQVPPWAWETSSITARPCRWAMARMGCMSQLTPPKWTVMIAPVRGVMAAWMAVGAML